MAIPSTGVSSAIPARSKLRSSTLRRHASALAETSTENSAHGSRKHHALEEANKQLEAANKKFKDREHTISALEKCNASLKTQGDTSSALTISLASCLKETTTSLDEANQKLDNAITKRDNLASQLQEARANMMKLRRSDRTKEKTQQQNLDLKALLHHQSARYNNNNNNIIISSLKTTKPPYMLQSALSAAMRRIDALETSGAGIA
ncbi:hypothetical protein COCVIDRAFT_39655 [Bipolaris victoriae FI3]|uniref:Uncharacterized protein n=1 Tax=Bipolaris victoriae (strain FI3) TaxID=930091 RepID=W7EGP4_BIPV3|nr:hypothetical protein COCVIDRAFT_39655 [Bipolaris victoriae FI3]